MPNGQHTNQTTKALEELGHTVRVNRPPRREDDRCDEPRGLTNDQVRMIEWYRSIAPQAPLIPCPPDAAFEDRINYSNTSGIGIDSIPYAFYRIHPALFAEILAWEVQYREAATISQVLTWTGKAPVGLHD